ncbi:MAG TPA: hypothetical protein EYP59_18900, partial [Thiotrichaceae bacterium]|nr:hypothetical protein [Thiotrichaceae bacterium]
MLRFFTTILITFLITAGLITAWGYFHYINPKTPPVPPKPIEVVRDDASRIALVMGIGNYQNAFIGKYPFESLNNPVNDATDMAKTLDKLGFEVILETELKTKAAMKKAVLAFRKRLPKDGGVGLFYFSGHGFQYQNANYLVPLNAAIASDIDIEDQVLKTDYVLRHLEKANQKGVNLMILDACRDSIPTDFFDDRETKGLFADELKTGFTTMTAPVGSLIAYSTAPNTTSWGGLPHERNSVYTKHLLSSLQNKPYLNITHLLMTVRQGVIKETENQVKQEPWEHTSLTNPFCFNPPCMSESEYQLHLKLANLNEAEAQRLAELEAKLKRESALQQQALLQQIAELKQQQVDSQQQDEHKRTEIAASLRQCEQYFKADDLTLNSRGGTDNTAFACYQQVLQQDKGNGQALTGLKNIANRYADWTQKALDNNKRDKAQNYLARLRQVAPHSSKLASLEAQLQEPKPGPAGEVFRDRLKDGSSGPEMVWIPKGRFKMGDIQGGGDSDEKPVHWVSVKKFAMGRYELTFAEYDKFATATSRKKPSDEGWGRGNRPVINVSWLDVTAYAEWLSTQTGQHYRLPTEAQWEYAARAGTKTKYWWGNDLGKNRAACDGCGAKWGWDAKHMTAPVGSFAANPFGLYDTAGNVWEWTCSEYENRYNGKEIKCLSNNRANGESLFVLRG